MEQIEVAKSHQGSLIEGFLSAPMDVLKKQHPLLLIGGVHGDEPEGVELAQATLDWLKSTEEDLVPWIVVPCLNPDGYGQKTRVNGIGVDLNRNYPSKSWSPEFEKERYFPGQNPGSEPEIKGICDLIETVHPRLIIHCHSWKPCIVSTGSPGLSDAKHLGKSSGYEVIEHIGYDTPGSLSEYGWHDQGIPIICIEEEDGAPLNQVWPRFQEGMKSIFRDQSSRR